MGKILALSGVVLVVVGAMNVGDNTAIGAALITVGIALIAVGVGRMRRGGT